VFEREGLSQAVLNDKSKASFLLRFRHFAFLLSRMFTLHLLWSVYLSKI
jgi:hypothetical protein